MQLSTTAMIARDPAIPRSFAVQIEIQRQVVLYSTALAGDVDSCTSSTLLNVFNSELDTIFTTYRDIWNLRLEVLLLGAKLNLFSLCLNISSSRRGHIGRFGELPNVDSARVLTLGFPSAVSLIHNMSKMKNQTRSDPQQGGGEDCALAHHPKYYFRLVMFSLVFLLKFLSANPKATQEDRELAISHITIAHQFFSSFSTSPEFHRVAEVIEVLVRGLKDDSDDPVPIRGRLGASLMFDTLKTVRLPRGQDPPEDDTGGVSIPYSTYPSQSQAHARGPEEVTDSSTVNVSWPSELYNNHLADSQAGIQDGEGDLSWMADEMLLEMFDL